MKIFKTSAGTTVYEHMKGEYFRKEKDRNIGHSVGGSKMYVKFKKVHREDGPAIECTATGNSLWYVKGSQLDALSLLDIKQLLSNGK